jgi:hypothetical protein
VRNGNSLAFWRPEGSNRGRRAIAMEARQAADRLGRGEAKGRVVIGPKGATAAAERLAREKAKGG